MKKVIIAIGIFSFLSCSMDQDTSLTGKWKLTEELMDIGDGKGEFKAAETQQFIEFNQDGTFSTTFSLCPGPPDKGRTGSGTFSVDENKLIPDDCAELGDRGITFELSGKELILHLPCIESCLQKYVKVN